MSIKQNDWIEVEYTGKLKDGNIFDTSKDREPLRFKVGSGMVIPGFDSAVLNLEVGSEKEFVINHTEAYGPKNTQVVEVPKASFKDVANLEKGKSYNFMTDLGPIKIEVEEILDDKIKAVINHPLAGEDLHFNIKVVKILSEDEVKDAEEKLKAHQEHHHHHHGSKKDSCDCDCEEGSCNCEDGSCDCDHKH